MKVFSGSAALRRAVPAKAETPPAARPAAPSAQLQAQRAASADEAPRQDRVAAAYRIERPMPRPRSDAPRGSRVDLLV